MEWTFTYIKLLALFIFCGTARGQEKINKPYDPYFVESIDIISKYAPDHITRELLQDKQGNFWFATWMGIIKYDGKVFINYTLKDNLERYHVSCCYEDKAGNLWFGTARGGVYRYNGKTFKLFTSLNGLLDDNIGCITEDLSGNIWLGTEKGTSCFNGSRFINYNSQNGFTDHFVNSIIQDKTGNILFGTMEGLYVFNGDHFSKTKGLPSEHIWSLLEDKKGNLWIGTYDGLIRYDGKGYINLLTNMLTYYIIEDKKGNIWLSHSEQNSRYSNIPTQILYKYDGKAFIKLIEKGEENDFQIFGKTVDKNGNLWFGTMHGPCCYDGVSFKYFTSKKMGK